MLDYPLADVVDLIREHLDHNRRSQAQSGQAAPAPKESTGRVIYRKAGDDWF